MHRGQRGQPDRANLRVPHTYLVPLYLYLSMRMLTGARHDDPEVRIIKSSDS